MNNKNRVITDIILVLCIIIMMMFMSKNKNSVTNTTNHSYYDTMINTTYKDSIIYDIKHRDSIIYKIKVKAKYEIEKAINANYNDAVKQFIILSTDTTQYDTSTGK